MAAILLPLCMIFPVLFSQVLALNRGIISLDNITFDKIIDVHKATLVKFDKKYAYGEKEEEFQKFALKVAPNPDFLVAEVGATDWGEEENKDLMQRFGVMSNNYPTFKLFLKGKDPVDFNGAVKHKQLLKFATENTGFWFGSSKGIPVFDKLLMKFLKSDAEIKLKTITQCQELLSAQMDSGQKQVGKIYVNIMRKVYDKGLQYITNEVRRVKKMLNEKITEAKKQAFEHKLEILKVQMEQ
eukprot:gene14273-15760_t